jgi:osmotically-inducible protein OsmY
MSPRLPAEGCARVQYEEEGEMPLTDEQIKMNVTSQLFWDDRVDASNVKVEVKDGTVILGGEVSTPLARAAAIETSWDMAEVRAVIDEMTTRPAVDDELPPDVELERRARNLLSWTGELAGGDLDVAVEDGRMTLTGTVDAFWKRYAAENLVRSIRGVMDVENRLTVVPTQKLSDRELADAVIAALERNRNVPEVRIEVAVEDGIVLLTGRVASYRERQEAFRAALHAAGALSIENDLVVAP